MSRIKDSDWMLQVTRLVLPNQSALFQRRVVLYSTMKCFYELDLLDLDEDAD